MTLNIFNFNFETLTCLILLCETLKYKHDLFNVTLNPYQVFHYSSQTLTLKL